jgi:hypothetical protein
MKAGAQAVRATAGLFIQEGQTIIEKALPCTTDHIEPLTFCHNSDWRRDAAGEGGRGAML